MSTSNKANMEQPNMVLPDRSIYGQEISIETEETGGIPSEITYDSIRLSICKNRRFT